MREKIVKNTMWMFNRYGIKAVTMDDIATKMNISKRTLYQNFSSRRELLYECVRYKFNEHGVFDSEADRPLLDILCHAYRHINALCRSTNIVCVRDIEKHYPYMLAFIVEHVDEYASILKSKVIPSVEHGDVRLDVSPELVESFVRDYFVRLFTVSSNEVMGVDKRGFYAEMFLVFVRGIATTKGMKYINETVKTSH